MLVIVEISGSRDTVGRGGGGGMCSGLEEWGKGGREWVAGESGTSSGGASFMWLEEDSVIHLSESQTSDLYKTSCIKSTLIRLTHPNLFDKRWYKRHFKTSCSCICVRTPEPCWFFFFYKIAILLYFGSWLLHKSNKAPSAVFPIWRFYISKLTNTQALYWWTGCPFVG